MERKEFPSNALFPVTISYSTAPNKKISVQFFPFNLLGRHVLKCAHNVPLLGHRRLILQRRWRTAPTFSLNAGYRMEAAAWTMPRTSSIVFPPRRAIVDLPQGKFHTMPFPSIMWM